MRKLSPMVFAAFLTVAPLSAGAQTVPVPVPVPPPASSTILGMPPNQALAIGVGMLAGGVGMSALAQGPFTTVVGSIAGALIGNWWYATQPMPQRPMPMHYQLSVAEAD